MRALKHRQLRAEGGFRGRQFVHPEPRREGKHRQERYPDPRCVLQVEHGAIRLGYATAAKGSKDGERDRQRRNQLHHADAKVAEAAIDAKRPALLLFREEEADVRHAGGKVRPGKTAQQGDNDKCAEWCGGILHRKTEPDAGNNQNAGAECRPATTAKHRYHKGVRYAQQRAGDRRQRRQHKQLVCGELKAHFGEIHRHCAKQHPDAER